MYTEDLLKLTEERWVRKPLARLYPKLYSIRKNIRYSIKQNLTDKHNHLSKATDWRLLEKEAAKLVGAYKGYAIRVISGNLPAIGALLAKLPRQQLNEKGVIAALALVRAKKQITSMEIDSMIWQAKFCLLLHAVQTDDCSVLERISLLDSMDGDLLCRELNPLEIIFREDALYPLLTAETRAMYRRMTAEISLVSGREETKIANEYLMQSYNAEKLEVPTRYYTKSHLLFATGTESAYAYAPEGDSQIKHIGLMILADYRKIFPAARTGIYLAALLLPAALLSAALAAFTVWWYAFVYFFLVVACIKPAVDFIVAKTIRNIGKLPQIELHGKVPGNAKTLCVMSTLLSTPAAAQEGFERLLQAKQKNQAKNITFCLLCDLPAAESRIADSDAEICKRAEAVFANREDFVVLIRERRYSKTQRVWQGEERKRGAIASLIRLLKNEGPSTAFRGIYGDRNALERIKYIVALDADTMPLMDSVSELVGIALHPAFKDTGIIAPRMTTRLDSFLKTGFSRVMAGNGGTAGVSSYDSFAGEFYQDAFGEGIFTGKGLISVEQFYEACVKQSLRSKLPEERVLSHDILEGGFTGVAYAGHIEFSDSFPETSLAFFKRQNRWIRGDLQNFGQVFNRSFSGLTRWKLLDNVRRALTPILVLLGLCLSLYTENIGIALLSVFAVTAPYLFSFVPSFIQGRHFANRRRFYAPVVSQTVQLVRQCLFEVMLIPKNALVSLDALLRTCWRMLFSKRHLLDWTTSAAFSSASGVTHLIPASLLSLGLLLLSILAANQVVVVLCVLFLCALPVMLYCDKASGRQTSLITREMHDVLVKETQKMWQFYADYVTEAHNFLPPDNVQYRPVYRVAARTSPTNIGMYLLSALCIYEFAFIDKEELEARVSDTISTIERLKKWHGNLMNWYSTEDLSVLSPFVSAVDSGNFICCLVALKQGLLAHNCSLSLVRRIERILDKTDLRPFYNPSRNLFSIGYDLDKQQLSVHHYDLMMSESRMLSYYAIATGQAGKEHWRALGRIMGRYGRYAAPVAWTGTMFEFFMPELLLESKEGSMQHEALKFALQCQEKQGARNHVPFGVSESGYYAFDDALNYQYKAHGVQEVGLKAGLDRDNVVSPYASFLALAYDPIGAYNNLARLEELQAKHPKYGFYEAVDFTPERVGNGCAIVKSHMAHHVGMSILGVTNALREGRLQKLFINDEKMKRAEELLEEKIIVGESIIDAPERKGDEPGKAQPQEITEFSLLQPEVNLLSNGPVTVLCADIGMQETKYAGVDMFYRTVNPMYPRGSLYGFVEGEYTLPFFQHPSLPEAVQNAEYNVVFCQNCTEYYRNYRHLNAGMQVLTPAGFPAEVRNFSIANTSSVKRQVSLVAYLEPALAREADIAAHPAFLDLFLQLHYDADNRLILARRKDRSSDKELLMAIGFMEDEPFQFNFNRESVLPRNALVFETMTHAVKDENESNSVPCPCVFLHMDFTLKAHEQKNMTLFYCYGESREEVVSAAEKLRQKKEIRPTDEVISPLVKDTFYGRFASRVLPAVLYQAEMHAEAVKQNQLDKTALWRFGLSGDLPIVLYEFHHSAVGIDGILQMKKALGLCQVYVDVVVLYQTDTERLLVQQLQEEIGVKCFPLSAADTEPALLTLIRACSVYTVRSDEVSFTLEKKLPLQPLAVKSCTHPHRDEENHFSEDGSCYIINQSPETPWSNILTNSTFGTMVSDRSLGFSFALNSRENKLTPWENNLRHDNQGERLFIRQKDTLYDLIDGSQAIFSPNKADYCGQANQVEAKTKVRVFEKGMGKEITITLENTGKKTKTLALAYYLEPVMGVQRENKTQLLQPSVQKNTLIFTNPANTLLRGAMTITCSKPAGFLTDSKAFWEGKWEQPNRDTINPSPNIIGAVIIKIELPPKHRETISYILGFTQNRIDPLSMQRALLHQKTASGISAIEPIQTGDAKLDSLYQYWMPWQSIGCRMWARTGFYQNSGAYGFRDQLQDSLSALDLKPELTKRQIARACAAQFMDGDVLHWWHDMLTAKKGVRTRYSDDLLWLPYVLCAYLTKTNDLPFLSTEVYYCDGDRLASHEHEKYMEVRTAECKESVYVHAKRALEKAYMLGQHGLLLMGCGDWCDGYNNVGLGGKGESVWLSMFYCMCAEAFAKLAKQVQDDEYADILFERSKQLKAQIDREAWDGEYYLRAFYDDGKPMGSHKNEQCKIDLLPQAFAVLCGMPDEERKMKALTAAVEQLCDPQTGLIRLFTPPFVRGETWQDPGYVQSYPPGVRENGGQYTHASIWLAIAFARFGMHDMALRLAKLLAPYDRNERYRNEPYYLSADIYTHPKAYGRGGWSMYTGSAGWYFQLLREWLPSEPKQ